MIKQKLIIATRKSPLALWQARIIGDQLTGLYPQLTIELLGLTTLADRHLEMSLLEMGGKGLFVKELEEALLQGRADIAVHSMKDVPVILPPGLILPVITKRADPRDVFVSNHYADLAALPAGARIGTSSLRRQTQLRRLRPDLTFLPLRGNIGTRLNKLDQDQFDAIILAAAGLLRMNLADRIRSYLSTTESLPAAGQGALGIECREGDAEIQQLIAPLADLPTMLCVAAERALCRHLGVGCQVPLAAFAEIKQAVLSLSARIYTKDASKSLQVAINVPLAEAEQAGKIAANELISQGVNDILHTFKGD